ncbi:MAG: response regulator transcription factor [Spirochaetaceae bacterium]|nr:response regulator transcription factor [Spirochaetaceae bacterium]
MGTTESKSAHVGIKVLLVDDQKLFVESLRVYMNTRAKDLTVVGVAFNGREAVEMSVKLKPDLVVMDVRMPEMDGVEASRILSERMPGVRVLMLTTFDDDSYVFEALKNGAVGYLLKDLDPSELVEAMRASISGSIQISPKIATRLVSGSAEVELLRSSTSAVLSKGDESSDNTISSDTELTSEIVWHLLSKREREILLLVARGLDNQEIAQKLNIALQTVKNRISDIYTKLDIHSRLRLIRLCIKFGW